MKKQPQQKPKPQREQARKAFSDEECYIANVPVKISIGHGETILREYEDVIDIELTGTTPEGKRNIGHFLHLKEQGFSTEQALFTLACKAAEDFSKQLVTGIHVSPPLALQVHIKRNGTISYGKFA